MFERPRISRHALQLFDATKPELQLDTNARRILALAARSSEDPQILASEHEERLAREVVHRAWTINMLMPSRSAATLDFRDRELVKKLGAILAVAVQLENELGDALACIDVALSRREGLLILRTREPRAFRGIPRRALARLGRALGRKLAISAVPLLIVAGPQMPLASYGPL